MATPAKRRLLATIRVLRPGNALVSIQDFGYAGCIERRGIEHYEAIHNGTFVGRASRYSSAARLLARHHGLRKKHTITVRIVHEPLVKPLSEST